MSSYSLMYGHFDKEDSNATSLLTYISFIVVHYMSKKETTAKLKHAYIFFSTQEFVKMLSALFPYIAYKNTRVSR